jgi:hypothetical protein
MRELGDTPVPAGGFGQLHSLFAMQWPVWSVRIPLFSWGNSDAVEYKYVKTSDQKTVIEWEQVGVVKKKLVSLLGFTS